MSADTDIIAMLNASTMLVYVDDDAGDEGVPNAIYWGYLNVDEAAKVIDVPLPYIVFNSSPGSDANERFCGNVGSRVVEFDIKGIGASERQAKWVLDEARKMLSRQRLGDSLIHRMPDNLNVRREDAYTRPGGDPLFYGVDRCSVIA